MRPMLRRALTGHHHHHPLCIVYGQWLCRATATLLSRAPPDLQNPTASTRHRPFSSTSLVRRLRKGDSERSSRLDNNSRKSTSPHVGTASGKPPPLLSPDEAQAADSVDERVLRGDDTTTQAEASPPAQANRSSTRRRTRALRPLLVPPSFKPSLLPITNAPISEPYQDQRSEQEGNNNNATETDAGSSGSTSIALTGLPPKTLKTDIRYVFQRFGEVRRVIVYPDDRRAEVVFADVDSVRRSLHAYAEQPLYVRGREIAVFRRRPAKSPGVSVGGSVASPRPLPMRHEQDDDGGNGGSIFVANFPAGTTHKELSEVFAPLGKYERFVMRMCFSSCHLSLGTFFFLSRLVCLSGPGSKYAYFVYSSDDPVENLLRVHERVPITFRGQPLRIERSMSRPHTVSTEEEEEVLEFAKPYDPATSSALIEELKRTVPGWKGTCEPSRVLWIGRLPHDISRDAIANFWSRLGCVVEVRRCAYNRLLLT